MDSRTLFTKVSPLKLFFIASVPGAVSMLASALYQLIDGILVGQILGEAAFAALNLAMPFVIINFSLADLIGVGSAVPISINLGKKKEKRRQSCTYWRLLFFWKQDMPKSVKKHGLSIQRNR